MVARAGDRVDLSRARPALGGLRELLVQQGREDALLVVGGIIPQDDLVALQDQGVARFFGPGTPTDEIVDYIKTWAASRPE